MVPCLGFNYSSERILTLRYPISLQQSLPRIATEIESKSSTYSSQTVESVRSNGTKFNSVPISRSVSMCPSEDYTLPLMDSALTAAVKGLEMAVAFV